MNEGLGEALTKARPGKGRELPRARATKQARMAVAGATPRRRGCEVGRWRTLLSLQADNDCCPVSAGNLANGSCICMRQAMGRRTGPMKWADMELVSLRRAA